MDTPVDPAPPLSDLTLHEEFGFQLGRLARWWRSQLDEQLKPHGLTQARWIALVHLSRGGDGLTQTELARFIGIEGPTLVRVLDALEEQVMIARRASHTDRRAKTVHLTARGREAVQLFNHVASRLRQELLQGIDERDLELCLRLFRRIRAHDTAARPEAAE